MTEKQRQIIVSIVVIIMFIGLAIWWLAIMGFF